MRLLANRWMSQDINNARLVSVATYNDYVPAFEVLFKETGSSLEQFYTAALELSKLPLEERTAEMQNLLSIIKVFSGESVDSWKMWRRSHNVKEDQSTFAV